MVAQSETGFHGADWFRDIGVFGLAVVCIFIDVRFHNHGLATATPRLLLLFALVLNLFTTFLSFDALLSNLHVPILADVDPPKIMVIIHLARVTLRPTSSRHFLKFSEGHLAPKISRAHLILLFSIHRASLLNLVQNLDALVVVPFLHSGGIEGT